MASVFKLGRDRAKKDACWYFEYRDERGRKRMRKGNRDRRDTLRMALRQEELARMRRFGLTDVEESAERLKRPIKDLLLDFRRQLEARQTTAKHVKLTLARVERIVTGCGFAVVSDLDPDAVQNFLVTLQREENLGHRTYNHYVQATDSFCHWLVRRRWVSRNPLADLSRLNVETDVRHKRRALKPDEFAKLVAAARQSRVPVQCYDGETRARLYIIAVSTGLRRKELASLTPRSFQLAADPPTVTVEAACSKHRRQDVLPLHADLVPVLQSWLAGLADDQPLFPMLAKRRTWLCVKKDLEAAGIPYVTADGIADFHAAGRHTHITRIANSAAVPFATAMKQARHTDPRLTMRYTHVDLQDRVKALNALGCQETVRKCVGSERPDLSPVDTIQHSEDARLESENPGGGRGSDAGRHSLSLTGTDDEKWRRRESNEGPPFPNVFPANEFGKLCSTCQEIVRKVWSDQCGDRRPAETARAEEVTDRADSHCTGDAAHE